MLRISKLYEKKLNNQGSLMKIIEYNNSQDIIVEFQDKHKAKIRTNYGNFRKGLVKNPYLPTVFGVGIIGTKYPANINCVHTKEYNTWDNMLERCYSEKYKDKHIAYQDTTCCDEWLLFENFCDWLCSQSNYDKWHNGKRWALDKDILVKKNKVYSPDACCLVPQNVNCLFLKREAKRGEYPIGVRCRKDGFMAVCRNPFLDKAEELGLYSTPEDAFYLGYKPYKENIIKQVAEIEYNKGNITKQCYEAMMNYEVEITD